MVVERNRELYLMKSMDYVRYERRVFNICTSYFRTLAENTFMKDAGLCHYSDARDWPSDYLSTELKAPFQIRLQKD